MDNRQAGKKIGGCIYIHKSYVNRFPSAKHASTFLPKDFEFDVIKINKNGNISFIKCSTFDKLEEPIVEGCIVVKSDKELMAIPQQSDPWIYHHKWMFVDDDYEYFDVEASKQRSKQWEALKPNKSKIGKLSYWNEFVIPMLGD